MLKIGQRILFISPRFFGYEKEIQRELEEVGNQVDWYDDRPSSTSLMKAVLRLRPQLVTKIVNKYFDDIIRKVNNVTYDVVFVIKGEALTAEKIQSLRQVLPEARFLYYSWDSFKNFKNSYEKLQYFDKVYSFDKFDSIENKKIKHLSLFYTRAYEALGKQEKISEKQDIDLLFLGSIHSDRYLILKKVLAAVRSLRPDVRFYGHFFYQSKWMFVIKKIFDRQFRLIPWSDVKWESLRSENALSLIERSQILVDVHHPGQTGLTMRTIECLGANRKLITTNPDVENYDFYNPENILIVDRLAPLVSERFINTDFRNVDSDICEKYSLRKWLAEIFC